QNKPLPEEAIRAILNAGRRAQSAKNMQPKQFIAITDKATLTKLSQLGEWAGHLAGAALGVAILTPAFEQRYSIMFDAGQAAAYMQLVAWELGIGSCPATIYETEQARQVLGFPQDFDLHVIYSFGYPEREDVLTMPPKKGGRKELDEMVHWNHW
ncbi:MAG: nitroreductase family protein, partial [Omnitrophica WOR_2 bacterium]